MLKRCHTFTILAFSPTVFPCFSDVSICFYESKRTEITQWINSYITDTTTTTTICMVRLLSSHVPVSPSSLLRFVLRAISTPSAYAAQSALLRALASPDGYNRPPLHRPYQKAHSPSRERRLFRSLVGINYLRCGSKRDARGRCLRKSTSSESRVWKNQQATEPPRGPPVTAFFLPHSLQRVL